MFIEGREQFSFLTGETLGPPPMMPKDVSGEGEDSLLRSMLINSMGPQIGKSMLYATTAKDLWDTN